MPPWRIASNCNPGTSYTTSMTFCVATAVLQMGLSVGEAVQAATRGGARALRRDTGTPGRPAVGHLAVGTRADLHCPTPRPPFTWPTAPACP